MEEIPNIYETNKTIAYFNERVEWCKELDIQSRINGLRYLYDDFMLFYNKTNLELGIESDDNSFCDHEYMEYIEEQFVDAGELEPSEYIEEQFVDAGELELSEYIDAPHPDPFYETHIAMQDEYTGLFTDPMIDTVETLREITEALFSFQSHLLARITTEVDKMRFFESIKTNLSSSPKTVIIDDYLSPGINRDNLKQKLRIVIKGKKGRSVAIIIKALEKKGYIISLQNDFKGFYTALKATFGDIGTYGGINDYYNHKKGAGITDQEIADIANLLP